MEEETFTLKDAEEIMSRPFIIEFIIFGDKKEHKYFLVENTREFEDDIYTTPTPIYMPGAPDELQGTFVEPMTIYPSVDAIETAIGVYGKEISEEEFKNAEKIEALFRKTGNKAYRFHRAKLKPTK